MSKKFGVTFKGLEDYIAKLETLGKTDVVKRGVEAGLKSSKVYVTQKLRQGVATGNLPAKGKYAASPHVVDTLDNAMDVEWNGLTGEMKIGFDLKKPSGIVSIFLMYGTPRMKPARGLKSAVYGAATKRRVLELEEEAINKVIKRVMEGS